MDTKTSGLIDDPMEVLCMLYGDHLAHGERFVKNLMPYGMLGPRPRGIVPHEYRYFPFIELSWYQGVCDLELISVEDHPVSPQVADKLIHEGWVEETSVINVYEVSLLGIAIYAGWRKGKLERAIGGKETADAE